MRIKTMSYAELIRSTRDFFDFSPYEGKTFLISGATGMIGKTLADLLISNTQSGKVVALGRSKEKAEKRFQEIFSSPRFSFFQHDLSSELKYEGNADYMIALASATHPLAYSQDPVGTLLVNITGLKNLLDWAREKSLRTLFSSSVEIYGENRGDTEFFDEKYLGYIDCNTSRSCYTEGKRAAEALCQGYISQYDEDIVIARIARVYGPAMLESDSKASSQFIKNALEKEDIVLKSQGLQHYSYLFSVDAALAILFLLEKGEKGEAYNVKGKDSDITLRSLAEKTASLAGTSVILSLPDEIEKAGYSKATKALLCDDKIRQLGYKPFYDISTGLALTFDILNTEGFK